MTSWDGKRDGAADDEQGVRDDRRAGAPTAGTWRSSRTATTRTTSSQVWLLPRAGGEAEKVTRVQGRRRGLRLVARRQAARARRRRPRPRAVDADEGDSKKKKTTKPIVIDRFQFKDDVDGYLGKQRNHLSLRRSRSRKRGGADLGRRTTSCCRPGRPTARRSPSSPSAAPTPTARTTGTSSRSSPGRAPRRAQLTTVRGRRQRSPTGAAGPPGAPTAKWIAYVQGGPDKLIYYGLHRLAVVPAAGGAAAGPDGGPRPQRPLAAVSRPTARRSSSCSRTTRRSHLARVPAGRRRGRAARRRAARRRRPSPWRRTAASRSSWARPTLPDEIYAVEKRRAAPRVRTRTTPGSPRCGSARSRRRASRARTAPRSTASWSSRRTTSAGRRYPTILRIHGGPVGQFDNAFDARLAVARRQRLRRARRRTRAAAPGRGEKFSDGDLRRLGQQGRSRTCWPRWTTRSRRGIADPDRLGVGGWSYGGILTNYVIASTTALQGGDERRRASRTSSPATAPTSTSASTSRSSARPGRTSTGWLQGVATRSCTPTGSGRRRSFSAARTDFNVPLINSEQMYQALRSLGVPTQLVIYPGQHHGDPEAELRAGPARALRRVVRQVREDGGARGGRRRRGR